MNPKYVHVKTVMPKIAVSVIRWVFLSCLCITAAPSIKWLYLSGGSIFEHWESRGFGWDDKEKYPKTLNSLNAGIMVSLIPDINVSAAVPLFYHKQLPFRDNLPLQFETDEIELTWVEHDRPPMASSGMGDIELGLTYQKYQSGFGLMLWIPTGYTPKERKFYEEGNDSLSGFFYDSPWSGFGVYRLGVSYQKSTYQYYFRLAPFMAVYKPGGKKAGAVEARDFMVPVQFVKPVKLSRTWRLKPQLQASYSRFRWEGKDSHPRIDMALEPGISISYCPSWQHEISFSASITIAGVTIENDKSADSPRKLYLGFYYGFYR